VATTLGSHFFFLVRHDAALIGYRFSRDYGSNTVAERDCPLDLEIPWIKLTNPDVLIGDVNFSVPVSVTLRPRLRFRCRPTGTPIEE
jgi:hypothetical protein